MKREFLILVVSACLILQARGDEKSEESAASNSTSNELGFIGLRNLASKRGRIPCLPLVIASVGPSACYIRCLLTLHFQGGYCNDENVCVCLDDVAAF